MENAYDALIMAASVLLLIIALTVSISSFTRLRTQVDDIVQSTETVELATDQTGSYINYITNLDDRREVGIETIIPAIRRLRKEQYTIYIYGNVVNTFSGDLVTQNNVQQLYNNAELIPVNANVIKLSLTGTNYQNINDENLKEIYEKLKDKKFYEYIGIYQNNLENVSEANKQTYRIITFVEI